MWNELAGAQKKEEELQAVVVKDFQNSWEDWKDAYKWNDTYIVGIMSIMGGVIEVGGG